MVGNFGSLFPFLMFLVWLAVVIYLFSLISRFVRAVERIADKFESR